MNINDLNLQIKRVDEMPKSGPYYVHDIDSPTFEYLHKRIVTRNFVLEPLGYKHFLDLFEFRLQNESDDEDPFEKLGERFETAYSQFFNYVCNVDNLAWVMLDRTYITGFFLLEMELDYNKYMERNAHLYYELHFSLDQQDIHKEMIKSLTDHIFCESDIPKMELHLEETEDDKNSKKALLEMGFKRSSEKDPGTGFRYTLLNDDPRLLEPPRHMPFVLKAYEKLRKGSN